MENGSSVEKKKRLKKFWMRVAEDAKVCISCLLLCNTFLHISWLKTTTLSYLPVSVSQGLSPAELGPLLRVSHAAARCQDIIVIWSSDWGRIESKSIVVVHSPLPVPVRLGLQFLPAATQGHPLLPEALTALHYGGFHHRSHLLLQSQQRRLQPSGRAHPSLQISPD